MRVVATFGLLTAFIAGPCSVADASPVLPPPDDSAEEGSRAGDETNPEGAAEEPAGVGNWTGVKIRPRRPRQDSDVRVLVRCPAEATDAIVASKPFNPPGSKRFRTAIGIGMEDNRGFDKKYIAYDALLGPRRVTLKCVKITMREHPRRRTVELVSRSHTDILVRRFKPGRF